MPLLFIEFNTFIVRYKCKRNANETERNEKNHQNHEQTFEILIFISSFQILYTWPRCFSRCDSSGTLEWFRNKMNTNSVQIQFKTK